MQTNQYGFSAIAGVIIAAVVVAGGAAAVSLTSLNEADTATTTEAESDVNTNADGDTNQKQATYQCDEGVQVTAEFVSENEAEVTLPNGEVRSVIRARSESGTTYESADGELVVANQGDGLAVRQSGETVASGCVRAGTNAESGTNSEAETDAGVEAELETSAETEAQTESSAQSESQTDTNTETESQTEATGSASGEVRAE